MVFTDTPGTAFDKISWDLSRLPKADIHIYSQYKIYLPRNISWQCYPIATSAEIAEALVEKFINLYTAPKAWITDQGPNFVNKVMRHIAHKYKISTYKNIAYRSQSNKSIKHSHHVLIEYLKQWSQNHDWDKYVTCDKGVQH